MRKISAIILQMVIFVAAYFTMTPDVMEDNTHLFGLFGDVEVIKGNSIWVLTSAAFLSVINILIWWPRQVKVTNTSNEAESTKSAEAKAIDQDPVVPKMD